MRVITASCSLNETSSFFVFKVSRYLLNSAYAAPIFGSNVEIFFTFGVGTAEIIK
jgi:hypothetical protein